MLLGLVALDDFSELAVPKDGDLLVSEGALGAV